MHLTRGQFPCRKSLVEEERHNYLENVVRGTVGDGVRRLAMATELGKMGGLSKGFSKGGPKLKYCMAW